MLGPDAGSVTGAGKEPSESQPLLVFMTLDTEESLDAAVSNTTNLPPLP